MSEPITHQITTESGKWTVHLNGEYLWIVNQHGETVHRSKTHVMTGVYLAVELARQEREAENQK